LTSEKSATDEMIPRHTDERNSTEKDFTTNEETEIQKEKEAWETQ
jgi:hypothetical protein